MLEAQPLWRSQLCEFIGLDEETLKCANLSPKTIRQSFTQWNCSDTTTKPEKNGKCVCGKHMQSFYFFKPTVVVRIIGTLSKYDQRRLWKLICIVNYFDYFPFRSEDWNGHSRSLVLCSVTHFCVVFVVWIIVQLEDSNMAYYKISVSHLQGCEVTNYKYSRYSN